MITQPDRAAGRSATPRPTPVKEAAAELGLPVAQPQRVRDAAFLELVRGREPELLVVVAYGRILPRAVLEAAPRGAINVHFSLLPKYRGAAPVQWALVNREPVTGVTTMRITEGLDEGPILQQSAVAIERGEHAPALTGRLAVLGAGLLLRTVEAIGRWDRGLDAAGPRRGLVRSAPARVRRVGRLPEDGAGAGRSHPWPRSLAGRVGLASGTTDPSRGGRGAAGRGDSVRDTSGGGHGDRPEGRVPARVLRLRLAAGRPDAAARGSACGGRARGMERPPDRSWGSA